MAIKSGVTNSAKAEFLQGIHLPSDVYKLALYTGKAKLNDETTIYDPANEVEGPGYEAGGKILSGHSVTLQGVTAVLSFDTIEWPDASISARGRIVYNASKENRVIHVLDFGEVVTSTNGPFEVAFPEGLISLS